MRDGSGDVVGEPFEGTIRAALPTGVVFAGGAVDAAREPLFAEEIAALGTVVAKRFEQFRAGRGFARRALGELGYATAPILIGSDRAPLWPRGVVASISHTDRFCGAIAATSDRFSALGLDIEADRTLDDRIVARISRASDVRERSRIEPMLAGSYSALVFSAKESIYKAFAPRGKRFLDFTDVELLVDPGTSTFLARVVIDAIDPSARSEFVGGYVFASQHVVTWATATSDKRDAASAA